MMDALDLFAVARLARSPVPAAPTRPATTTATRPAPATPKTPPMQKTTAQQSAGPASDAPADLTSTEARTETHDHHLH